MNKIIRVLRQGRFALTFGFLLTGGCAYPPAPAPASPGIDWARAPVVKVYLALGFFRPGSLTLYRGQSVRLVFQNGDGRTHDFVTNLFTAVAQRPDARRGGVRVILQPIESIEYDIVPEIAGTYTLETFMFVRPNAIPPIPIYVR